LRDLFERNERHATGLAADHFDDVQDGQLPAVVSVCCSDARVPQAAMWAVDEPGWVFTPSTIGNVVWERVDGDRVVDGSVLYPMLHTDTAVAAVVGHTGCGAVTAALDAVRSGGRSDPPGVRSRIAALRPVVREGLDGGIAADGPGGLVDRLVEHNVDRQVSFLRASDHVPDGVSIYGFVYDLHGVYGDRRGWVYLVNADGETAVEALRDRVPDTFADHVRRLA
jgi:carbonic anhydrase